MQLKMVEWVRGKGGGRMRNPKSEKDVHFRFSILKPCKRPVQQLGKQVRYQVEF